MKRILCFGDSNTWGYIPGVRKRYAPEIRWPGVAQRILGDQYLLIEEGLNGRTTVYDNPCKPWERGIDMLPGLLVSHNPLDLVIIMLGTNDVKEFFGMPPYIIARGAGRIIEKIQQGTYGPDGGVPEILLVAPLKLNPSVMDGWIAGEFGASSVEKDARLAENYAQIAKDLGVHFMNAAEYVTADEGDGVHMNEEGHAVMAEKMIEQVKNILG